LAIERDGSRAFYSGGCVHFFRAEIALTADPKLPFEDGPASSSHVSSQAQSTGILVEPEEAPADPRGSSLHLWMHRSSLFLFVLLSAGGGVLLVILPWTPQWTDNYLLLSFPWLRGFFSAGFFRGLCSGLGLLDIWIGFWEALHYHEHH
jgi:hypothetical protein